MKGILSTAIAILSGLVVLAGYFFKLPFLITARGLLLEWAVILAAVAIFVGVFNLLQVNNHRIRTKQKDGFYSFILIFTMLVTLTLGLIFKTGHPVRNLVFNSIQLPVEASLMAVLAVTLLMASFRLFRRQASLFSIIFIITALVILLGTAPLPFMTLPFFSETIRPFIAQVLAAAGARGILLGVALGTLTTGLRVLFGADRPYGGK